MDEIQAQAPTPALDQPVHADSDECTAHRRRPSPRPFSRRSSRRGLLKNMRGAEEESRPLIHDPDLLEREDSDVSDMQQEALRALTTRKKSGSISRDTSPPHRAPPPIPINRPEATVTFPHRDSGFESGPSSPTISSSFTTFSACAGSSHSEVCLIPKVCRTDTDTAVSSNDCPIRFRVIRAQMRFLRDEWEAHFGAVTMSPKVQARGLHVLMTAQIGYAGSIAFEAQHLVSEYKSICGYNATDAYNVGDFDYDNHILPRDVDECVFRWIATGEYLKDHFEGWLREGLQVATNGMKYTLHQYVAVARAMGQLAASGPDGADVLRKKSQVEIWADQEQGKTSIKNLRAKVQKIKEQFFTPDPNRPWEVSGFDWE